MLPSCRQATEQLSEQIDQPIRGMRWLKLKIHLLICEYCRRYGKQISLSAKTINLMEVKNQPNEVLREKLVHHYRESYPRENKND